MQNELPPKILYQYRPPEKWAFDNLCRQVVYFGSPENFNDPYDCGTPPTFRDLTDVQLLTTLEKLGIPAETLRTHKHLLVGKGIRSELARKTGIEYIRIFEEKLGKEYAKVRKKLGVACLSEHRDNLLMWSQYGGRGEGFCLAFDTEDASLFSTGKIIRVQYSDYWPNAADAIKLLDGKNSRMFLAHKSKDWEYEQEWRLFGKRGGERRYKKKTLKAIFFGTKATESTKEIVRLIVREKYPHTELWSGKIHTKERKVEFDLMPRTPHK